ncbi:expressed unknown protein [Seminavis robusta]|uniref:Uncharacterized protein n=1 Tax=Seminavis robusta TaxID=568900 RepID=A0A9N8DFF4_9STRA|nr:expressed unknown protein [Seminavis robusta]|eukprot:Sro93_g048330.1 n/a (708) ;mRNA; f:20448-22649
MPPSGFTSNSPNSVMDDHNHLYTPSVENGQSRVQRQDAKDSEMQRSLMLSRSESSNEGDNYSKMDKGHYRGNSLSPDTFARWQIFRNMLDSPKSKLAAAVVSLIAVPLMAFGTLFPAYSPRNYAIAIWTAWDGLLSSSSLSIMFFTFAGAFLYVELATSIPATAPSSSRSPTAMDTSGDPFFVITSCPSDPAKLAAELPVQPISGYVKKAKAYALSSRQRLFHSIAGVTLFVLLVILGIIGPYSIVYPSWLWYPLAWGSFHVYDYQDILPAINNICRDRSDLCLSDREWEVLSSGALSPHNFKDRNAVVAGQNYAKTHSIVVNVLARNMREDIPALRTNIESIAPFFREVALVVFENDSNDGTREGFKQWAAEVKDKNYFVDVMECEGVVDCKLNRKHRDAATGPAYDYSGEIGEMHNYRNMAVQYITHDPKYKDFSHVLVMDVDLGVPFSPLGILHTLGSKPDHPVACSGHQLWITGYGGLSTPYDLNAFRQYSTPEDEGLEDWTHRLCELMPPGERWRSECDALSPTRVISIMWNDRKRIDEDLYRVVSAFNGAALYPVELLRSTGAMYDDGDPAEGNVGQRCEHVGLNKAVGKDKPMYVNKKWNFNTSPTDPAGATGARAQKVTNRIMGKPKLFLTIFFIHLFTVGVFVWATMTIGVYAVQPLVSSMLKKIPRTRSQSPRGRNNRARNPSDVDADFKSTRKISV